MTATSQPADPSGSAGQRTFEVYITTPDPLVGAGDSPYEGLSLEAALAHLGQFDGSSLTQLLIKETGSQPAVHLMLEGEAAHGVTLQTFTAGPLLAAVDPTKCALSDTRDVVGGSGQINEVHMGYLITIDAAVAAAVDELQTRAVSRTLDWVRGDDLVTPPVEQFDPDTGTWSPFGT